MNNKKKYYLNASQIKFLIAFKETSYYKKINSGTKAMITLSIRKGYIVNKKHYNKIIPEIGKYRGLKDKTIVSISKGLNPFEEIYIPIESDDKYLKYKSYLKSAIWKRKRVYIINKRNNKCEKCGNTDDLQVHHMTYERLYKEYESDLQVLCHTCHKETHFNE